MVKMFFRRWFRKENWQNGFAPFTGGLALLALAYIGAVVVYNTNIIPAWSVASEHAKSTKAQSATKTNTTKAPQSSSTKSTATPNSQPSPSVSNVKQTQTSQSDGEFYNELCGNFYRNANYTYNTGVLNLASALNHDEYSVYSQATKGDLSFNLMMQSINFDISNTNSTINKDWQDAYVNNDGLYGHREGCKVANPNVPKVLQVPQCEAVTMDQVSDCMSQINPSLGI